MHDMSAPQHSLNVDRPSRFRLLLVDDDPSQLQLLTRVLTQDAELQVATAGSQAVEVAKASPPDLILLDVQMPDMDGFDVCERLRQDPATRHIPVIFLTGLDSTHSEKHALSLGAVDYITKPIDPELARQRVRNQLDRQRLLSELAQERNQLERRVHERTAALNTAKEAAESALKIRDAILSNLSHEMRTPMNGILGFAQIAKMRNTQPELDIFLTGMESSAQRLFSMLNKLFELAEVESNHLEIHVAPFELPAVLQDVRNACLEEAQRKGMDLVVHVPQGLVMLTCLGDRARVAQILQELADNAIKFSAAGQVRLQLSMAHDEDGPPAWVCEVSDQGIGITNAAFERIFQPFEQLDASKGRRFEGNGVGLTLSRQMARKLGGDIGVRSVPGVGSIFSLTLPLVYSGA
jgi:signal transduction histidine kinase